MPVTLPNALLVLTKENVDHPSVKNCQRGLALSFGFYFSGESETWLT
jgi:hypothetical protein